MQSISRWIVVPGFLLVLLLMAPGRCGNSGEKLSSPSGVINLAPVQVPIPGPECGPDSVCIEEDGFLITLLSIVDDPQSSTRTFEYEVCGDTDSCPPPPNGLSNFRIDLPEPCVEADQVAEVIVDPQVLTDCDVFDNDNAPPVNMCPPPVAGDVVKCDVIPDDFGKAGECTTISIVISGEPPVGIGLSAVGTKAGNDCQAGEILGPSCEPCDVPPDGEECLTRTAGFWGTHPHITDLFIPIEVCGLALTTIDAATEGSAIEDLCVAPGKERRGTDKSVQQLQLFRQLAAAKLNLNATAANAGSCDETLVEALSTCGFDDLASLEAALCFADGATISESGCIEAIDDFNNAQDTLQPPPAPFDSPGPADPTNCRAATGNGFVNDR